MTFMELVLKIRDLYEDADAREVFEHIAIEIHVTGEAAGVFYIEVAERHVCVEPYDYHDKDIVVCVDTEMMLKLLNREIDFYQAVGRGLIEIHGNRDKYLLLQKIRLQK